MLFVLGDSHARSLHGCRDDDPHEVTRPSGRVWRVLGTGGATAHGLINPSSSTGAGQRSRAYVDLFRSRSEKVVFLMFGDVDCVEHALDGRFDDAITRYRAYMADLRSIPGVTVLPCMVYPRTEHFTMYERPAEEFQRTIRTWNGLLGAHVDTFSPLVSPAGFLRDELCHDPGPGERHLSREGVEVVWRALEDRLVKL